MLRISTPRPSAGLLARLRAIVRRGRPERPTEPRVGDLRLDPATRQAWRGGSEVVLSAKEFALLETFMRRPGEVLNGRLTGQAPVDDTRSPSLLEAKMSWKLEGSYFETCSCDVICPCTASLALGATNDRCKAMLVFHVQSGEVDGTDVSGQTVAAIADTPKVMSEGNWRLGVFIDAAASDEQAEKLGAVFSGALGGPMEALGPLVGENLGVERLPIEVHEDGLKHSIRIGEAVDFEIEDVVPFGVESGEPAKLTGIFHPAGSELTVAHATRSKIDAFGIQYEGKAAFSSSRFAWAA